MKKISIIVPVYNAEKYLQKCCASILEQNYQNIELILINDGSSDSSEEICKNISLIDSRVIYRTTTNQGVSVARNIGIDIASGEYIMFVDSDDWLEPNSLENIADAISNEQDIYVFSHWQEYKDFSHAVSMQSYEMNISDLLNHLGEISELSSLLCTVWNKVYKHSLLKEKKIRFLKSIPFAEDFLFNMDYLTAAEMFSSNTVFFYHYNCINLDSATHKFFPQYKYYIQLMYQKFKKLIWVKGVQNENIMIHVFDFILDRYEYALQGCLDAEMSLKNKCSFLHELIHDMDPELRRYSEKTRYTIAVLARKCNSHIFDFYVIKLLLKKFLYNMRYRITIFYKGVTNGKFK